MAYPSGVATQHSLKRFEALYQGTWSLDPKIDELKVIELQPGVVQLYVPMTFMISPAGQTAQPTRCPAAVAAKNATTTIPIVVTESGGDPVATGLVKSLSRPSGNITGVSDMAIELAPKRLEVLKDMVPTLRTVAMLWNVNDLGMTLRYQAAADAARTIGARVQPLGVREPEDFDEAFTSMVRDPPDAILMVSDALTRLNRRRVYEFAAEHRLPTTYERASYVREGGLSAYSPDLDEIYDRATNLIDRILKGAKPADLPFEQPTRFHLSINLKTAKALGITVPASVIARADEVIE